LYDGTIKSLFLISITKATTMLLKSFPVFICLCIFTSHLEAQERSSVKFGHVSADDFDISKLTADTTDGAVIIADIGYSSIDYNNYNGFTLNFKRQTRIKIINKNGFDLANVPIPLYQDGETKEILASIKGVTYNLENGKVIETKLSKDAIFEDNYNKNHVIRKFTLPEVKEGSIIEYSYTINSGFLFNLQPWEFQGRYPCLWSEYEDNIPTYFDYVTILQGYQDFYIKTESEGSTIFGAAPAATVDKRWVIKNVPSLKEEKFTSSIKNHISKVEFQMSSINFPGQPYKEVLGSWTKLSDDLLKGDDFGEGLNKNNGWLNDSMKTITSSAVNDLDKAHKIYNYVKNNIKSTHREGVFLGKSVKDVFKDKNGSVADLNILLITMLRHENIQADPVILSTVNNGYTNPIYPIIDKFNYVICKVSIDTNIFFLDASRSYLGFGRLPIYCYNGYGRVINAETSGVSFSPDTLQEPKTTNVNLFNDSITPGKWVGEISSALNYKESNDTREKIADKGRDEFDKDLRSTFSEDLSLSNITIKHLDNCDKVVQIDCGLTAEDDATSNDIIYFDPIIGGEYKENPLKSANRKFPVEMPYLIDETYTLNLEVPTGYEVDELPKSAKIIFNDGDALFEYYISNSDGIINLSSHLKFSKATFVPDDYNDLREFFDYIVKKNSEQIVFKKKK